MKDNALPLEKEDRRLPAELLERGGLILVPSTEEPAWYDRSAASSLPGHAAASSCALLNGVRAPILLVDAADQVIGFNPAAAELLGEQQLSHRPAVRALLPFVPALLGAARRETSWQGQIADAAGRKLDVEVACAALGEHDRPAVAIYLIYDVSAHVELSRLREQLLYDVAHELRGPLMVLDNALEMLTNDDGHLDPSEVRHLLHWARRTATRLRDTMDDLLSAGSIRSGRFLVQPHPASIAAIVAEALESVGAMLETRKQRLEQVIADRTVLADRRYLRQVVSNLLTNAAKYSPSGGLIRIFTTPAGGYLRLTVEDSGPGISTEQQPALFERFYRPRSADEQPGIGLGLAIAKGIVEAHGGQIGIDSQLGSGTRVWFTVPVVEHEVLP